MQRFFEVTGWVLDLDMVCIKLMKKNNVLGERLLGCGTDDALSMYLLSQNMLRGPVCSVYRLFSKTRRANNNRIQMEIVHQVAGNICLEPMFLRSLTVSV